MKVDQRLRVRCRSSRPVGARLRVWSRVDPL